MFILYTIRIQERLLIGGVQMEHEKKQFKNKTELAKALNIGSRKTLYERAKKNNVDLDKLEFDEEELSYLSGKSRRPIETHGEQSKEHKETIDKHKEQSRYTKETQEIAELKAQLAGKDELIEELRKDKADLSKKLDENQQSLKSLLTQQQLLTLHNSVTEKQGEAVDGDFEETEQPTQEQEQTDKPKKHWWNIFS